MHRWSILFIHIQLNCTQSTGILSSVKKKRRKKKSTIYVRSSIVPNTANKIRKKKVHKNNGKQVGAKGRLKVISSSDDAMCFTSFPRDQCNKRANSNRSNQSFLIRHTKHTHTPQKLPSFYNFPLNSKVDSDKTSSSMPPA